MRTRSPLEILLWIIVFVVAIIVLIKLLSYL